MIQAMKGKIIVEKVKSQAVKKREAEDSIIKGLIGSEAYGAGPQPISDPVDSNQRKGIVISVGEGIGNVKVRDTVIYKNWSSDEFTEGDKNFEAIEEYGVIAIVTDEG